MAAAGAAPAPTPDDVAALTREVCSSLQGVMMLTAGLLNECPVPVRITLTKAPREGEEDLGGRNPVMIMVQTDDNAEHRDVLLSVQFRAITSIKQALSLGKDADLSKWRREHARAEVEAAKLAKEANDRQATLERGGRGHVRGRGRGRGKGASAAPATEAAPAATTPAVEELDA